MAGIIQVLETLSLYAGENTVQRSTCVKCRVVQLLRRGQLPRKLGGDSFLVASALTGHGVCPRQDYASALAKFPSLASTGVTDVRLTGVLCHFANMA